MKPWQRACLWVGLVLGWIVLVLILGMPDYADPRMFGP